MITIEFLFSVLINLIIVSMLSLTLINSLEDMKSVLINHYFNKKVFDSARIIEIWLYCGFDGSLDYSFKIEKNLILKTDKGLIETEGVFLNDEKEPL